MKEKNDLFGMSEKGAMTFLGKMFAILMAVLLAFGLVPVASTGVAVASVDATSTEQPEISLQASAAKPVITVQNATTGKVTVKKGATYNLKVSSPGAKLTYKSSKPKVAKIQGKGKVKALKAGKTTITITAKKGKAKATKKIVVTVVAAKKFVKVKSLSAKADKTELSIGAQASIKTTIKPAKASNKNLIYKSSNTSVVEVTDKGKVSAKAAGSASVTVTSADNAKAKATINFTVAPAHVPVTSIAHAQTKPR